jgi:hypothetical protein
MMLWECLLTERFLDVQVDKEPAPKTWAAAFALAF